MRASWQIGLAATLLGIAACSSSPASDDAEDYEWRDAFIRSDVPLWVEMSGADVTPRPMLDGDIGCIGENWHFFGGEWEQTFTPDSDGSGPDPVWWRLHSTGSFHCGGWIASSEDRAGPYEDGQPGYVVALGHDKASGLDLIAWETGMRGGSTYLLLAARPGEGERYHVLDPDCSFGRERAAADGSSYITSYCAIPDRAALRATAAAAANRRPRGEMIRAQPVAVEP